MLAITYKKITKIEVAKWGTPKKYFLKNFEDLVDLVSNKKIWKKLPCTLWLIVTLI
jgi:hypothetical protein